ncbi:hypothetical protein KIM30_19160 [Escherichia coli]
MAAFGFSIYDKNNVDVTGVLTPIFYLDRFTAESGSKTYTNKPEGKTLQAVCSLFPWNNGKRRLSTVWQILKFLRE